MYFPVNFAKFLRAPSLQTTSGQLLLYMITLLDNGQIKPSETATGGVL